MINQMSIETFIESGYVLSMKFTDQEIAHAKTVRDFAQDKKPDNDYFVELLKELADYVPMPMLEALLCADESYTVIRWMNKVRIMRNRTHRLIDLLHFMIVRQDNASLVEIACWHPNRKRNGKPRRMPTLAKDLVTLYCAIEQQMLERVGGTEHGESIAPLHDLSNSVANCETVCDGAHHAADTDPNDDTPAIRCADAPGTGPDRTHDA